MMALSDLQEVPETANQWDVFTFALRTEITKIRQAIFQQKNIVLQERVVDPLNPKFRKDFLQNNQTMHQEFNTVLGLQSQDLQDIDIENREQLSEWVNINYQEIYAAQQALGV